ncbi:MAG: DUF87 domain-containing protein [Clostridiales bacterium]|nr:DUF87 domain-containing protein [Clostridiales bacterium]
MGIKNRIKRAGGKAADTIAKLSVLSPEQLHEMEKRREEYLTEVPGMDDEAAEVLTKRLLSAASIEIYNEYLKHINELYVPVKKDAEYDSAFKPAYNIRYINITKWVTDKKENNLEKLVNVYEVLSDEDCNIALVFHRTMVGTSVYLAVTNTQNTRDNVDVDNYRKRLLEAIRGNFPGAEWTEDKGKGVIPCMNEIRSYTIASASNIPGEKSEKFISQTIEKLLDGIIPDDAEKEYTIVLLATPVKDVEDRKLHLADLYSGMAPYSGWQTNFTYTQSDSTNSMATFGLNAGVSAGVQSGRNASVANTSGVTDSEGSSITDSTGTSASTGTGTTVTEGTSHTAGTNESIANATGTSTNVGVNASVSTGGEVGIPWLAKADTHVTAGGSLSQGSSMTNTASTGSSVADTASSSTASSVTQTLAKTTGRAVANTLGRAVSNSATTTDGLYKGVNLGGNFGANFARSSNVSATVGKNEGITQSFTNYTIKHTLEILEDQMKRLEQSTALGMWDFAAYFISEDQNVASNAAHSYLALTQGEKSYMSQTAVNLWRGDTTDNDDAQEIYGYLRELRHPVFGLSPAITAIGSDFYAYPAIVTATTSLSGKELAYSLNFPQKSVAGFPVLECAEFGRNVVTYGGQNSKDGLRLGKIFHMNHEERIEVSLARQSLAAHVFITGSTGSGKSNAVYQLLDEVSHQNIVFLVVEPAKGEYKNVFGSAPDVFVYGTNPHLSPMLRLNPFSFPEGVHIFEHLDRLVEIFNVCWPMYAAMPAVLKAAIEKSYEDCGWDMIRSENKYGEELYPSFSDVARNIKTIIETSEYDAENKGAYKGSLLTRLQSLTNGINGTVFVTDELSSEELFEQNVIVDLSRVGSAETKSLIMGILVLKLQEYRLSTSDGMNSELRHITVLEEAHNLLKKTSAAVSSESGNLLGKSVEMISNAIAEMRTYGESFVIVDQAPGLLDMAAIRNTNTKIIMRLPDQEDRELVGRAANLNDDQIQELAKLPCGVGAVYQNEWVQPVLCKINKYEDGNLIYRYTPDEDVFETMSTEDLSESLLDFIMEKALFQLGDKNEIKRFQRAILQSKLDTTVKIDFMDYLVSAPKEGMDKLRPLLYDLLQADIVMGTVDKSAELSSWTHAVVDAIKPSLKYYSNRQINMTLGLLLYEHAQRNPAYNDLHCRFTEVYKKEGRVF